MLIDDDIFNPVRVPRSPAKPPAAHVIKIIVKGATKKKTSKLEKILNRMEKNRPHMCSMGITSHVYVPPDDRIVD